MATRPLMKHLASACSAVVWLFCLTLPSLVSAADHGGKTPPQITEHLGAVLPLDRVFRDETGKVVPLSQFFGERPVVLDLVFYNCPSLCNVQLNAQLETMKRLDLELGRDYDVVSISIDPAETAQLAASKKASYIAQLGGDGTGWHFLTGKREDIKAVADVVGYAYHYDAELKMYVHAAAVFFVSPDGRLVRYLHGLSYPEDLFRMALLEAGAARSLGDHLQLWLRQWDGGRKKYAPALGRIIGAAGGLVMLLLALALAIFRWRQRRSTASPPSA